jgi:hypothetical protein
VRTTAAAALLLLAGCGKPVPPSKAPNPANPAPPVQHLRVQPPPGAEFRYLQRRDTDGTWDGGKAVSAEVGGRILACLDGAVAWSPREKPGEAAAFGQHAHAPAFASALQVRGEGREELYTFCYTLGLFNVHSATPYFVVPEERRAELTRLLKSLGDPDRQSVAR